MSDLVGNPEDRFSQNEAHLTNLVLQVSPPSILKPDKVVLKSVSDPVPPSTRRNGRHSRLRKHFSEPVGLGDGTYRKQNAVSSPLFCG